MGPQQGNCTGHTESRSQERAHLGARRAGPRPQALRATLGGEETPWGAMLTPFSYLSLPRIAVVGFRGGLGVHRVVSVSQS